MTPALKNYGRTLWGGFRYDPVVLIALLCSYLTGTKTYTPKQITEEDLIAGIKAGKSLIRLGDGEAMLMTGRDIHYQKTSPALNQALRTIISDYQTDSPYLLGVPMYALTDTEATLKSKGRLRVWRLFRTFFGLRFSQSASYYCAIYFYTATFEQKIAAVLASRRLICVAREAVLADTNFRQYFTTHFRSVDFIPAPATQAFDQIDALTQAIDSSLAPYNQNDCTLILAAGPAAKVLAYTYAKRGVQALDVGHGIEIIGQDHDYSARI